MPGVNKVIILGRLGRDPESRTMQNGNVVVTFSMATSETWNDKSSGERKERTQWHRVVIFNEPLGKIAEQYLRKGSEAYVEGALETRKYTDKEGGEREATEIVLRPFRGQLTLVGGRNDGEQAQRSAPAVGRSAPRSGAAAGAPSGGGDWGAGMDDDIPF
jgi:single-strand DNA-binding protein